MGRPPKPEAEKYVRRVVSFPPELWRRIEERIPERERSPFIQRAVAEKLGGLVEEQAEVSE